MMACTHSRPLMVHMVWLWSGATLVYLRQRVKERGKPEAAACDTEDQDELEQSELCRLRWDCITDTFGYAYEVMAVMRDCMLVD